MITKRLMASVGIALSAVVFSACGSPDAGPKTTTVNLSNQPQYVKKAPATTPPPSTAPDPAAAIINEEQIYTVQSGDSLSKIASLYGFTVDQIVQYNDFGNSAHLITQGDQIKIPRGGKNPAANPVTTTTLAPGAAGSGTADAAGTGTGCTYTIASGDNPTKVAKKFKITVDQLKAANAGGVMATFLVGAQLQIPPEGKCP